MAEVSQKRNSTLIAPGTFEPEHHWYPKALNATIHPMINFFLNLSTDRIIKRYCHLHPTVSYSALDDILHHQTEYFRWAGADLLHVTNENGKRQMVVIENNSCPSGQKSMPLLDDHQEQGAYKLLMERTILPYLQNKRNRVKGDLAVVYDKNPMEASGYAATLAELTGENVHYAPFYVDDEDPPVRFEDGIMEVRGTEGAWHRIRAAFRYLTQKPWNRLPVRSRTRILNPVLSCLAGGRNKMVASKAYELFNSEISESGLQILTPETIWDVSKNEVPLWVRRMGGQAVVKVPYSNAGQGVFTIVNESELQAFMDRSDFEYDQFIVQSLIGNYHWSSYSRKGRLYHLGTIPNNKGNSYVADIRLMVSSTSKGIRPLCIYSRRARKALVDQLEDGADSWDILGTNLSIKKGPGEWDSDTNRLLLADRRDFNKLGMGLDDLIEAYIQTVLSMIAIDNMAKTLTSSKGTFRRKLFRSLDEDDRLLNEIKYH